MSNNIITSLLLCMIFTLQFCLQISAYDGKTGRNIRLRSNLTKRPLNVDNFSGNKQPILTNEGWRPIFDIANGATSSSKYRKYPLPSQKYSQNVIYTPEYYANNKQPLPQKIYVSNPTSPKSEFEQPTKSVLLKNKKPQQNIRNKHPTQYEVYENVDEDSSSYDSSQNRFRYQEVPLGKPTKTSGSFGEGLSGKYIQHLHLDDPLLNRFYGRTTLRNVRLSSTSRRPF